MSEILTTELVSFIRDQPYGVAPKRIEQLCASHEALRVQLAEVQQQAVVLWEDEQDITTVRDMEQMWRQELQADLLALAEAVMEYPGFQAYPKVYAALARPGVQLAVCLRQGHLMSWTSSSDTTLEAPPGFYTCQRCFQIVNIKYKEKDDNPRIGD